MKILVPFKSVPDPNDASVTGAAAPTPKSVINPFDEIAIEEALRIRERGDAAEIVGITIGTPAVDEQIRAALAMGVDRPIRVDYYHRPPPQRTALRLAAWFDEGAPQTNRDPNLRSPENHRTASYYCALHNPPAQACHWHTCRVGRGTSRETTAGSEGALAWPRPL